MNILTQESSTKIEWAAEHTLRSLGLCRTYKGFGYLIYAVGLTAQDIDILTYICKGLYKDIAKKFHTTDSCAERNIRTIKKAIWRTGNKTLRLEIFGEEYRDSVPKNAQFIELLTCYIIRQLQ